MVDPGERPGGPAPLNFSPFVRVWMTGAPFIWRSVSATVLCSRPRQNVRLGNLTLLSCSDGNEMHKIACETYCFFCLSRCRRRRRCLSSLITWYKNAGWDTRQTKSRVCHSKCSFPLFRPYKGIQDSCEFWIPRRGFRIRVMDSDSLSVSLGFWTPIASGIPAPTSSITRGFQSPGFRIPQAKISWITDSANQNFLNSQIRILFSWGGLFVSSQCCSRVSAWR